MPKASQGRGSRDMTSDLSQERSSRTMGWKQRSARRRRRFLAERKKLGF